MMKNKNQKIFQMLQNNRGNMLLLAYFVIIIMIGLGAAFAMMSINESRFAERNRQEAEAFHIAEAGIEMALYHLRQDFESDPTSPDWFDSTINIINYTPSSDPLNYDEDPGDEFIVKEFGDGTYTVLLKASTEDDHIWIKSTGTIDDGDSEHVIEVYVKMINLSPWDNAIFAGAGASGSMINGNVDIRGSVHILGNNIADGSYALDLGGTSQLVGNNYDGLDSDLEDKVPVLPKVDFGGQNVETLNAELRVKKGLVGLSGNASVGEENDTTGNLVKETVDGVYVTDGYGGSSGDSEVFSDNDVTTEYDLGDAVEFPSLFDPYETYVDYYDYFDNTAYTPTAAEMVNLAALDPGMTDFEYGSCGGDNCIAMNGGVLTVQGKIYINGGTLGVTGGEIEYNGQGTILVTGDVTINESLVTKEPDVDADSDGRLDSTFPSNVLAIMTPSSIYVGTGAGAAQLELMGLFYAEEEENDPDDGDDKGIVIAKQTDVIGTIVSNYFNMGGQVPSIYQVPEVMNNLPDGLISANAYWYVQVMWMKI